MSYLELPNEQRMYTPFGILQNPDHVWPRKPSGVVRSLDVLKFGWLVGFGWSITAENASYIPSLALGIRVGNRFFSEQEDFQKENIELSSDYHTKNIIRQKWFYHALAFSASFSLIDSNTIACQIKMANEDHCPHTIWIYGISELLYPEKSIIAKTGSQKREIHLQLQGEDEYHRKPTFTLISQKKPARALLSTSREEIRRAIWEEPTENQGEMERRHYAAGILEFRLDLMRQSEDSRELSLCKPLPGVSYERWKWPQIDSPVTEGYGWGAFSIDMILRYLIGFREMPFSNGKEFRLYPNLPGELVSLVQGGALCVKNLRFRDLLLDVQYSLSDRKRLDTTIEVSSKNSFKELWVTDACQNIIFKMGLASGKNSIKTKLDNGRPYTFHFQQH